MVKLSHEECEKHYWATKIPPSIHTGTKYKCTEQELEELRYAHTSRLYQQLKPFKLLSREQAVCALEDVLRCRIFEEQLSALKRLRKAVQNPHWTTDIFAKAFNDLDMALFNSKMKGRVRLVWRGSKENLSDLMGQDKYERVWGQCQIIIHEPVIITQIALNAYKMFMSEDDFIDCIPATWYMDQYRQIWRTLLHEMIVSVPRSTPI